MSAGNNTTTNNAHALAAFKKHGVSRLDLERVTRNLFHFPAPLHDLLENYTVLYWSGSHANAMIKDGAIILLDKITRMPVSYNVIFQHCTPHVVKQARQVRLSFRSVKEIFGISPVVIVQLLPANAATNATTATNAATNAA